MHVLKQVNSQIDFLAHHIFHTDIYSIHMSLKCNLTPFHLEMGPYIPSPCLQLPQAIECEESDCTSLLRLGGESIMVSLCPPSPPPALSLSDCP